MCYHGLVMMLDDLRKEIDGIDVQIIDLLKRRARCVHEVGVVKREAGSPTFVPERESSLMEKLMRLNAGELPEKGLLSIYRQIMSLSFHLEGGMKVAYMGPEGTWSHQAALARFGESVDLAPYPSFAHVFSAVEREEANYGVIPIENSTDGQVSQAMDIFSHSPLRICAQIHQSVQNCLMANVPLEKIKTIYSHPQVLGQCRQWLLQNFPGIPLVPTSSTTAAAKVAVEEASKGAAALGSRLAAEIHRLNVLKANIQDKANNTTRFAVIGHQETEPCGHDRTTICFTVPHTPGSLADVLLHFKKHGINLLCMDSRPTRDVAWEYLFYVDAAGHEKEEPLRSCLEEMHNCCLMFKVLGSYPEL